VSVGYMELIDLQKLQRLQEDFCRVAGVCVYCLDGEGRQITEGSGKQTRLEKAADCFPSEQVKAVVERVEEGSLEDQAIEEFHETGDRVAAVAVRAEGRTVFCWVVFAFGEDGTDEAGFLAALDLLRNASNTLMRNKLSCFSAEMECRRSRNAEQEMSSTLRSIEATTEIVQLLDSDDRIEAVMDKWLGILARHLQVDTAQIYRLNSGGTEMEVLCEWCEQGRVSAYDRISRLEVPEILKTDKPLVISAEGADAGLRRKADAVGLQAVIIFPIIRQENADGMVLSLNHRKRRVNWDMSEIKFTADGVKVLQSILTRRIQKNSLTGSYAVLEAVLDNVGCAIYVTRKKTGEKLFANRRLQSTFAKELRENTLEDLLQQGITAGNENGYYEVYHIEKDRWYDLLFKEISWVDGTDAVLYSLYDITDKKQYQRKIEQQAHTDFLTGLYNRMCCERDLARQIDQAKKTNAKGALFYLDLDDFKHINDGLGHQYGDVLLKAISHELQRVKGIERTCYRMGGDEFIIVVPPEQYPQIERILEDIRRIFAKPWFLKDADYYCTMSMGIVTFPDLGESVADLTQKADIAMYEAKKGGKNRIARYSGSSDSASGKRLDMEKNMRDAAVDGYNEFEVYYQPIADMQKGGRCAGAEALLRWNSSKLGFITPAEFIPLAEYLGLINPIGNYVLREACIQCRRWNEAGYDYKVSVNLSVVQLLQADVVEIVEKTIEETGIAPRNLTLEVTESLAINDMERMQGILNRIKALGVRIALDDFGTGYSSLNHIREIPFDMIKVDQSFVRELAENAYSQSFVKMVAELAETLGANICVEGIETEAQYRIVKKMKVKYIQGFYFDRPMKRDAFEAKYCEKLIKNEEDNYAAAGTGTEK
ncbi:MAG: EAL domain-containing protein, partial [Butyrivibrio sp.]|nr:EAL domain-containing protein [Acetatifactor muris]MCM1559704.1 EAL domain-containing protein [Butyrivibrio sp.]